jgi:hypothetical protein
MLICYIALAHARDYFVLREFAKSHIIFTTYELNADKKIFDAFFEAFPNPKAGFLPPQWTNLWRLKELFSAPQKKITHSWPPSIPIF